MNLAMRNKFAQQYANNYVETSVAEATPYKLVQLLYEAGLKHLGVVKVFIERRDMQKKSEHVNKIIGVLHGLKAGLDLEAGGEVAANLWALYDYLIRRTFEASAKNDLTLFAEVAERLKDLSDAWAMMPPEYQNLSREQLKKMHKAQ